MLRNFENRKSKIRNFKFPHSPSQDTDVTTPNTEPWSPTLRFPKRVVILGGDHVAWMAATLIARTLYKLKIRTTVCPGQDSQTPSNRTFTSSSSLTGLLASMGVDEHDLLKACGGTYRLATQFSDWSAVGRDFWQPLGVESLQIDGRSLFDVWATERIAGRLLRPLHSYSPHWTACLAGKAPHSFSGTSAIGESGHYGFHGDAGGLATWFRSAALQVGVEEVAGQIGRTFPNGRGGIGQVKLQSGHPVPGDLFIDCRAPDQISTDDFSDLSDRFLCNRRVNVASAATRQVQPFTRVTALDSGWQLTAPLAAETRHSYAFSSHFVTDDTAAEQLTSNVNSRLEQPLTSNNAIDFGDVSHYRRRTFCADNVLHLGRSAWGMEALSSTDLHVDLAAVELMLELFPDRSVGKATREEFNRRMTSLADEQQTFLQLHHALVNSADTAYREAAVAAANSDTVQQLLAIYDATTRIRIQNPQSAPAAYYHGLLAGCSRLPKQALAVSNNAVASRMQQVLRDMVQHNEALVKDLPVHEELLDWIHTGPFQQRVG